MRIDVIKNFVTSEECKLLNEWTHEGVKQKWLDAGFSNGTLTNKRLTSRMYGHRFTYPEVAYRVLDRIRTHYGFEKLETPTQQGRDGIVVSYTNPTGDVYPHKDPRVKGMATLRCNVVTQAADSGGLLFVDDEFVDVEPGDLHCYLASEHEHRVTEVEGTNPRILWMFGLCIPTNEWE